MRESLKECGLLSWCSKDMTRRNGWRDGILVGWVGKGAEDDTRENLRMRKFKLRVSCSEKARRADLGL